MKKILSLMIILLAVMGLSNCRVMNGVKGKSPELMSRHWRSHDGKIMPWTPSPPPAQQPPKAIVITIHGLNGAASDFWQLSRDWPALGYAVYGIELRGQGNDPVVVERGDIANASLWFGDLKTFHHLIKSKYPKTPIFWYAESMGTLIAIHAIAQQTWWLRDLPDGLILSAPPAGLRRPPTGVKKAAIQSLIAFLPWKRVDLEKLGSSTLDELKVTKDATLKEQSQKTPHYVPRQTLRLLGEIDRMVQRLSIAADRVRMPTLILASPNDAIASEAQITKLFEEISAKDKTLYWYRNSYHLLLHDVERDQVYEDVTEWITEQTKLHGRSREFRSRNKVRTSKEAMEKTSGK